MTRAMPASDARKLLRLAASTLEAHGAAHVIQRRTRLACLPMVVARVEWKPLPGVLSVWSESDGCFVAWSEAGQPERLARAFKEAEARSPKLALGDDRRAWALSAAADMLRPLAQPRAARLPLRDVPRKSWPHEAVLTWPGVVSVRDIFTGEEVARSAPGACPLPERASATR